ncbi:MAG: GNAT family protein [Candidatus Aenigmatarchaeota archaeon]
MSLKINGERIVLKIPEMEDVKNLCRYINDKAVARFTTIPYPYKLEHAKDFIKRARRRMKKKEGYEFSIFLKETGEIIGGVALVNINKTNENAELGYWLARKYWGQGLMSEAVKLILEFGFKKLKLHKIYARVCEPNKRSSHLLEKFGFKLEGKLREHWKGKFSRKWYDEFMYGLLKEEWKSI